MKMHSWLTVAIAAALLSGGCASPTPAPVELIPPPAIIPETKIDPVAVPPAPAAVASPTSEEAVIITTAPADGVAPPAVELIPPPPLIPATAVTPVAAAAVAPPAKPKAAAATAPKVVTYAASPGKVNFDHQKHAGANACSACHATMPPAKVVLGKDKAHQLCKGCHQKKGAPAPTACGGCHKKG